MVLRNHLAQLAIEQAEKDDFREVRRLLDELKNPYESSNEDVTDQLKPSAHASSTGRLLDFHNDIFLKISTLV